MRSDTFEQERRAVDRVVRKLIHELVQFGLGHDAPRLRAVQTARSLAPLTAPFIWAGLNRLGPLAERALGRGRGSKPAPSVCDRITAAAPAVGSRPPWGAPKSGVQ